MSEAHSWEHDMSAWLDSPAGEVFRDMLLVLHADDLPFIVNEDGQIMNFRLPERASVVVGEMPGRA